ncbi:MAG: hypothetical protein ACI9U2_002068 [Bradymonadia bacterium]
MEIFRLQDDGEWQKAQTIMAPPGVETFGLEIAAHDDHVLVSSGGDVAFELRLVD